MLSNFKKKQKRGILQKHFLVKISAILLITIAFLLIFADIKIYKNKKKLQAQLQYYKNQIEEIEKRNQNLEEGIAKAGDKEYIEKVAREEFGMQQQGEKVVVFIEPKQTEKAPEEEKEKNILNIGDWLGLISNFLKSINK